MTPMIDIIFLLLTFFVLSARFQEPEQILQVDVGKTSAGPHTLVPPLKIVIDETAGMFIFHVGNKPEITFNEQDTAQALLLLTKKAQESLEKTSSQSIELYCDDSVPWDIVVKVYDALYASGVHDMTFKVDFQEQAP